MRVLYIGGTGEISEACVHESVKLGDEVTVLNRGLRKNSLPSEVKQIQGSKEDLTLLKRLAADSFDVVCQFLAYEMETLERDIEAFGGRCSQYVMISSASAYGKPMNSLRRLQEDDPLNNSLWPYSKLKAEMENRLGEAHREGKIRGTIVRPSHTYRLNFPNQFDAGEQVVQRMLMNKPVIVHGDGTSLSTLTHAEDFAVPFAKLLGQEASLGEAYHITNQEPVTWELIYQTFATAVGVESKIVHVSSEKLVRYREAWRGPLFGDKSPNTQFDNSKITALTGGSPASISLEEGLGRVAAVMKEKYQRGELALKPELDQLFDRIIQSELA